MGESFGDLVVKVDLLGESVGNLVGDAVGVLVGDAVGDLTSS